MGPAGLCLRLHADYLCQHAGACCTAGWAIPIEERAYEQVRVHFGGQGRGRLFADGGPLPEGAAAVLGVQPSGACVFFEPGRGNLCAVHRELGAASLPSACRHFPRIVLHDARGTLVSLSHFCPTAAGLLRSPNAQAFEIVRAPGPLALEGDDGDDGPEGLEGLDARDALPPLLRPGMLTDLEGYDAWERAAIALLARNDLTAERRARDSRRARRAPCNPGGQVAAACVRRSSASSRLRPRENRTRIWTRQAATSCASVWRSARSHRAWRAHPRSRTGSRAGTGVAAWWDEVDDAVRGYLAARLFGNWIAYHGQGLHTIVEYLQVALAVLKMEAVRHHAQESPSPPWQTVKEAVRSADLLLVHLADTRTLSRLLEPEPAGVDAGNQDVGARAVPSLRRHQHALGRSLVVVSEHAGPVDAPAHPRQRAVGDRADGREHGRARLRDGHHPGDDHQAACAGHRLHRSRRHVARDAGPRHPPDRPLRLRRARPRTARRSHGGAARVPTTPRWPRTGATISSRRRDTRCSVPTTRRASPRSSPPPST